MIETRYCALVAAVCAGLLGCGDDSTGDKHTRAADSVAGRSKTATAHRAASAVDAATRADKPRPKAPPLDPAALAKCRRLVEGVLRAPNREARALAFAAVEQAPAPAAVAAYSEVLQRGRKARPIALARAAEGVFRLASKHPDAATAAVPALIDGFIAAPSAFPFFERALAATGPSGATAVRALLSHRDGGVRTRAIGLVGDLRDNKALPALIQLLDRPGKPAYHTPGGKPGPNMHLFVLGALAKIGNGTVKRNGGDVAIDALVRSYWLRTNDAVLRAQAFNTYGLISSNTKMANELARWLSTEHAAATRVDAAYAFGRLAKSATPLAPLIAAVKTSSGNARLHRQFAGALVRALVGKHCGDRLACYAGLLDVTKLSDTWMRQLVAGAGGVAVSDLGLDKTALLAGVVERAALEVGKRGTLSQEILNRVLRYAHTADLSAREAMFGALIAGAKRPCRRCVALLDQLIERDHHRLAKARWLGRYKLWRAVLATRPE